MGRAPCCDKLGLKKGPWTPEEDQKLIAYIQQHGHGSWRALPKNAGLLRCGKSCRLRWTNYLRPDIKRGRFSLEEEQLIIQRHAILGNRWSAISTHLPGRTDNEIKNYWNTHLKKRLLQMGIDPVTHKPKMDLFDSFEAKPVLSSTLSHMAQWENARLEAEARLAREYLKLASCRQPCGNGMIQMADGGRAWKGELWESIRKDFSSTASMDQYSNCSSTDFRKVLRDWEQSLQGHALNFSDIVTEDRFSTQDLSFSLGNDMISLPFDVSHTALLSESLGLKGVPKLEQNLSPSCCSLDSMDDHCRTDNSLQCESLLQQTEKLLQNKALLSKEVISADAIQNPVEKSHETSLAAAISEPSAFSEVSAINAAEDFWPEDKITKERVVNTSCSSPALAYTNDLLSQETNNSISFAGNSSYTSGLQLPAELLLDLASLQQQAKSATCAAAVSDQVDLSSFSDQAVSMQSKDYWCNVLKLVGSPVLG